MDWDDSLKDFQHFLQLEKSLSGNSIDAYTTDINKLIQFVKLGGQPIPPEKVTSDFLSKFLVYLNELGMSPRTQARVISGLKAFYRYLLLEDLIHEDPTSRIEAPKIGRKLPEVLSVEEIDRIISVIDLSKAEGHRNRAIIETLYSCGLRVSELISLRLSDVHLDKLFIKVIGKGDKERLVPIGKRAVTEIENYLPDRNSLPVIEKNSRDILFLNRRGKNLTRVMIFTIIKNLAKSAGIKKNG
jgi:integrase/recombinase XerD